MAKLLPSLCLSCLLFGSTTFGSDPRVLYIKRVVDGDTLVLSNKKKIRLIGVDTPESHVSKKLYRDAQRTGQGTKTIRALGRKATLLVRRLVEGKPITLEFDPSHALHHHQDKYGRTLAYIYLGPLAKEKSSSDIYKKGFLNAIIVVEGYGQVISRYPFKYQDQFLRYQRKARLEGRGLWKEGE